MTFEYGGKVVTTQNILDELDWKFAAFDWEMRLLDFRVIPPSGPNQCVW